MAFKPDSIVAAEGWTFIQESTPSSPQYLDTWYIPSTSKVKIFDINSTWKYLNEFDTRLSGGLWSWGAADSGITGLNLIVRRSSPVQVGSLTNWNSISVGFTHAMAIKSDGTLWTWGGNTYGQLGFNNTIHRSSPIQVGSLTNWSKIFAGQSSSFAIKTDGTLWSWGYNAYGQLGQTHRSNRSSPIQIGTLNTWIHVRGSENAYTVGAIQSDQSLWTWGENRDGSGGWGIPYVASTGMRSSPTQVAGSWKWVAYAAYFFTGIKTNGTLWICGNNSGTYNSSPVQLGSDTDWKITSSGDMPARIIGLKNNNTLWIWGANDSGSLGNSSITVVNPPTQLGTDTWLQVETSAYAHTVGIKTDSTLWSWGLNAEGQLGLSDIISRSSPVQIGNLNSWKSFGVGASCAIAIK